MGTYYMYIQELENREERENIHVCFCICDGSRKSSLMIAMMVVGVFSSTLGLEEES